VFLLSIPAIECPHLPPPEHGTVRGSLFVYNSVLDFTCDRGYHLRGVKGKQLTRRCTAEAEWDGHEALCLCKLSTGRLFLDKKMLVSNIKSFKKCNKSDVKLYLTGLLPKYILQRGIFKQ
jgi:hypothetical protein